MFNKLFGQNKKASAEETAVRAPRPSLELSGPRLAEALRSVMSVCEAAGGAERYVEALAFKSSVFRDAFSGRTGELTLPQFLKLCMFMPTVRRKAHAYFNAEGFAHLRSAITDHLLNSEVPISERLPRFEAAFPANKTHRWVRDLGAEILHNVEPERFPAMMRWVWDAGVNTGVIREIWHAPDIDHIVIEIPDDIETFIMLREELAQYLTENGVYRDVLWYVDLLCGHIYARYVAAQGGTLLRTDFGTGDEDLAMHLRRILGLDGVKAKGDAMRELEQLESQLDIQKMLQQLQEV